ncbi:MAG: alternative ribosome rescue aminoacyl-tRNA hydrolase ArfB [Candidatus Aminicenantes bacterium]|nr:alternative ribosome rescue aminoacyl-tRNA hydrolase ArfB [Candidatus Aminicenantes bacterium]
MVHIRDGVDIKENEFRFVFSRSSGPGGQNVNKVDTRVTLVFDLMSSGSLTSEQKTELRRRLAGHLNRRGELRVVSQRHRSQWRNRQETLERFRHLLASALEKRKRRYETRIPARSRVRRLEDKAHRSRTKQMRRKPAASEY